MFSIYSVFRGQVCGCDSHISRFLLQLTASHWTTGDEDETPGNNGIQGGTGELIGGNVIQNGTGELIGGSIIHSGTGSHLQVIGYTVAQINLLKVI